MESDLDRLKLKILEKVREDKRGQAQDQELLREQVNSTNQVQCISAFSLYVQENQQKKRKMYPTLSYLEVVSLLQEEWQGEAESVREEY